MRQLRQLSPAEIEKSDSALAWINQFPGEDRLAAQSLLMGLRFVTRAAYIEWINSTLDQLSSDPIALYAIRDVDDEVESYWNDDGSVVGRPGRSQGSEDLVYSVVSQAGRRLQGRVLDHPGLDDIKKRKVRKIVLIDDSIGSGAKTASFVKWFFNSSTIKSWWSYGYITIVIVSIARSTSGEALIWDSIPGSDSPKRVKPKRDKVKFVSVMCYSTDDKHLRWGSETSSIIRFCQKYADRYGIPRDKALGYGGVMGCVVFEHGIPNNVPYILFHDKKGFVPVFPKRTMPQDLITILSSNRGANGPAERFNALGSMLPTVIVILRLISSGIRTAPGLAHRMSCDLDHVRLLFARMREANLISASGRLTDSGRDLLRKQKKLAAVSGAMMDLPDLSSENPYLRCIYYIPRSWRTDQVTIQPLDGRS